MLVSPIPPPTGGLLLMLGRGYFGRGHAGMGDVGDDNTGLQGLHVTGHAAFSGDQPFLSRHVIVAYGTLDLMEQFRPHRVFCRLVLRQDGIPLQ